MAKKSTKTAYNKIISQYGKPNESVQDIMARVSNNEAELKQYAINYLKGYLGKDVTYLNFNGHYKVDGDDKLYDGSNIEGVRKYIEAANKNTNLIRIVNNTRNMLSAKLDSIDKARIGNIKINDIRKVDPRKRMSHSVNSETVRDITRKSIAKNIDPNIVLAIALQESGIGNINPLHNNSYQSRRLDNIGENSEFGITNSIALLDKKRQYANKLGKTNEADVIQAWNGYGKIDPAKHGSKMYGTDGIIDMSKTPLYGNRVIALRDSAIATTPEIQSIIKEERAKTTKFKNGGTVTNNNNDMAKKTKKIIDKSAKGTLGTKLSMSDIAIFNRDNSIRIKHNLPPIPQQDSIVYGKYARDASKDFMFNFHPKTMAKNIKYLFNPEGTIIRNSNMFLKGDTIQGRNNIFVRPSASKKYGLGGVVGGIANMAMSMYNAAEAKADQNTANKLAAQLSKNQRLANDQNFLDNYNSSGYNISYYKNGGFKLNARTIGNKSKFKPIGDGVFKVQGASHANGGVKLGNAEVEGGELFKFTPNGVEILSDNKSKFGYSPADNAENNPSKFDLEFIKQEATKHSNNITNNNVTNNKFGLGGGWWNPSWSENIIKDYKNSINKQAPINKSNKYPITPYIVDNVTNAITTAMTPNVPVPTLESRARLNTDINVNPQIDAVKSNETANLRYINNNISDSNVASVLSARAGNTATTNINSILANEINTENTLKNAEVNANIGINARNAQTTNNFMNTNMMRSLGINKSINENISNFSRDLVDLGDKKRFDALDNRRISIQLASDTEGALSKLIENGDFDTIILDQGFNIDTLPAADKKAALKRIALNKMRR